MAKRVLRLGPFCVKRYAPHKRLREVPAVERLRREVLGARLLRYDEVIVAKPIVYCERSAWMIRWWYQGDHPRIDRPLAEVHLVALAHWLKANRGRGCKLDPKQRWDYAIVAHLALRAEDRLEKSVRRTLLGGDDLLHGDLVAENLVLQERRIVVLDSESVSRGHSAWDAGLLLSHLPTEQAVGELGRRFLTGAGLEGADADLAICVSALFRGEPR